MIYMKSQALFSLKKKKKKKKKNAISCLADDLQEMLSLIFSEKKKSNLHQLHLWLALLFLCVEVLKPS